MYLTLLKIIWLGRAYSKLARVKYQIKNKRENLTSLMVLSFKDDILNVLNVKK